MWYNILAIPLLTGIYAKGMNLLGTVREYVDSEIEKALYEKIDALIETEPPAKAEVRKLELEAFRKRYYTAMKTKRRQALDEAGELRNIYKLSYQMLPELLDVAGINIRDMYGLVGIEVDWINPESKKLGEACDKLPPNELEAVKRLAFTLAPGFWRETEVLKLHPTRRAILIFDRLTSVRDSGGSSDKRVTPALKHVSYDRKYTTTLKTVDFPEIAKRFGVSLHWLTAQEGLADEGKTWINHKQGLRENIDKYINSAADFEEFLSLMRDAGYEVGEGLPSLSFRTKDMERYSSAERIGEFYSEAGIRERIASKGKTKNIVPTTVMAEREETEVIIDAFLFMPERARGAFLDYVVALSEDIARRSNVIPIAEVRAIPERDGE